MTTATKPKAQKKCKNCGEPEMLGFPDSGDFGWFTDYEGKDWCNRCGQDPTRKAKKVR